MSGQIGRERERIARDLHDVILNQLSRLGFELSSIRPLVHGAAEKRLDVAVQDVDGIIRDLRQLVFGMLDGRDCHVVETEIGTLVDHAAARLQCPPSLSIEGDLDAVPPAVVHHLTGVVSEAVHNVVAHAKAASLEVHITIRDNEVEARVTDDGVGVPGMPVCGLGLGSMAARARELRGTFALTSGQAGGTVVRWCVPYRGLPASRAVEPARESGAVPP